MKLSRAPEVTTYPTNNQITRSFIVEKAPWWGSFWERLIRSLKRLLKKVLGRSSLRYDELNTIIIEIESLINAGQSPTCSTVKKVFRTLYRHHNSCTDVVSRQCQTTKSMKSRARIDLRLKNGLSSTKFYATICKSMVRIVPVEFA